MKIRKNSEQRNFEVNRDALTYKRIESLLEKRIVTMFDEETFKVLNYEEYNVFSHEVTIRIFADDCKEIKVIYDDEFGAYETIVITNDGEKVPVCL